MRAQFGRKAFAGARIHRVNTEPDLVQNVCLYISNFVTHNNATYLGTLQLHIFKRIIKMLMEYYEDPAGKKMSTFDFFVFLARTAQFYWLKIKKKSNSNFSPIQSSFDRAEMSGNPITKSFCFRLRPNVRSARKQSSSSLWLLFCSWTFWPLSSMNIV